MGKYLVLGLGKSGLSTLKALQELSEEVVGTDKRSIDEIDFGNETKEDLARLKESFIKEDIAKEKIHEFDTIVKSPGISYENEIIKAGLSKKIQIIDEIELTYNYLKPYISCLIAITGTNGKTTTTTLIGKIIKSAGYSCHVVGNIGNPISSLISRVKKGDIVVCEVSSFQLEGIINFKPDIALLLNLAPDHLDRHKTFENYINAKLRLFENQNEEDIKILNYDDEKCKDIIPKLSGNKLFFSTKESVEDGANVIKDKLVMKQEGKSIEVIEKDEIKIPGEHNIENILASICVAKSLKISPDTIKSTIANFYGVEHRLEKVGEYKGVTFYNDSKATNIEAASTALEAVKSTGFEEPLVLILGGMDKGEDFDEFVQNLKQFNAKAIILGETKSRWIESMNKNNFEEYIGVSNLEEAVKNAYSLGKTVLFSPGCASWDMFSSYEERGRIFKEEVIKWGRD